METRNTEQGLKKKRGREGGSKTGKGKEWAYPPPALSRAASSRGKWKGDGAGGRPPLLEERGGRQA